MRLLYTTILLFVFWGLRCQGIDSAWIAKTYVEGFTRDTGLTLQEPYFVDNNGHRRTLSDFKGKVLYIDVWTTWCGNCLARFPYSKKLIERLKSIQLDTAIQFVTICTEGSISKWKKLLKKYNPEGIALYTKDTSFYKNWHIDDFPTYILLDRLSKIIASDAPSPDDGIVDYILYAAVRNIKPATAIWTDFRQNQYYSKNHSFTNDNEGVEYGKWFYSIIEELFKYSKWRDQQRIKNSR